MGLVNELVSSADDMNSTVLNEAEIGILNKVYTTSYIDIYARFYSLY